MKHRIEVYYNKNLNMSVGKIASQVAHAVRNLDITANKCDDVIVVLMASRNKIEKLILECETNNLIHYVQRDQGFTEVCKGDLTAIARVIWQQQN